MKPILRILLHGRSPASICIALFELIDTSTEKVVDHFELADPGLEGCIGLKKAIVGEWWFEVAIVCGGR